MPGVMSCGPAIVATTRRPLSMRCSTARARAAPVVDVDVARGRALRRAADRRPSARRPPASASGQGIGAVQADHAARRRRGRPPGSRPVRRASSGDAGIRSTSCRSRADRAALMPRSSRGKNGSVNRRGVGSAMTTATEPLRRVTRLRAARLGTYPSSRIAASTWRRMSGLTLRRVVDDARDRRAGHAGTQGDLFEGRAVAAVGCGRVGHDASLRCESALTLRMHHIRPCQESALTTAVARRAGSYAKLARHDRSSDRHPSTPRGARSLRGRHRHRGPLPAADRVEDVLLVLDRVRRRGAEQPHLPGLSRPPWRAAGHQPPSRGARPGDRPRDRGDARPTPPAGTARTTSTRTCRRATRSASTTCRSRRPAG